MLTSLIGRWHNILLSKKTKKRVEEIILILAISSYLIHLIAILLNNQGFLNINDNFLTNPIAAIYTPFSFILVYEVYLLIYYIPKSVTIYIGKQYEIITLIIIRRIFKDIAYVELNTNWFQNKNDLQFTFDVITSIILFFIIFQFYNSLKKKETRSVDSENERRSSIKKFIAFKKAISVLLVPILFFLSIFALGSWIVATYQNYYTGLNTFKSINSVFYDDFFTIMIIVDVLLLLLSFFYSDKFHKIIRNSGFVISTILIKVSFLSDGIVNNLLILSAVIFGYLFLIIHNLYEADHKTS